jgi:pheromone shutdown protein TraB
MQGFKPGQEFIVAVQEGQKIGADIVLGDQVRLGKGRVTSLVHAC